jgi:hypothetical protein
MVIPSIEYLKHITLSKTTKTTDGGILKAELMKELESTFAEHCKNKLYLIAALLDPRYKTEFFSISQSSRAVDMVNDELKRISPTHEKFIPASVFKFSLLFLQ